VRLRRHSEREQLARVFRENVDAVYGFFAYSVTLPVAEDLTGETFERVVRSFSRYDPGRAAERTWIMAIARNLLTDHFRRERHRRSLSTDAEPRLLEGLAVDDVFDRLLMADELRSLLGVLSQREREVVALRYGADLSAAEVARIVDLSSDNVHQIASRALRRLRTALEEAQRGEQRSTHRSTSR
jgi:RNA polymerase sigma factor (sigma-70 family)